MSEVITLVVDGKPLDKTWSDIHVKRSMESLVSSFDFVSTQGQPFDYNAWPIKMGADCSVLVDGESVLVGYIEDINIDYSKDTHTVQVAGRDVTCDLVDCHQVDDPFQYGTQNAVSVKRIVKGICAPFDIEVIIDPSAVSATNLGKYTFYIQPGDPLIGSLYRITRWARVFMLASTDGKLILTMAGSRNADANLMSGTNILRGGFKQSAKERFSVYYVKGIGASQDNLIRAQDWLWMNGRYPTSNPASYPDARVGATRYRPFANEAETSVNIDNVGWRAKADAQYRIGNSLKYEYVVQGWREKEGGQLWAPNTMVKVTDPLFGLDNTSLLIESVDYTQTDQGSLTQMILCSKEKYTAQAEINRIKSVFDEKGTK